MEKKKTAVPMYVVTNDKTCQISFYKQNFISRHKTGERGVSTNQRRQYVPHMVNNVHVTVSVKTCL